MKKGFSIIVLMVLFLSCKENENIVANELIKKEFAENEILLNKSAEEEILQLKNEGINLFHETRKIYDKSKKDYALVTFASESRDNLKEYLLTNSLNIKLSSEKLLPIEKSGFSKKDEMSQEIKSSMYIFLGEVFSKDKYRTITVNVSKNKNARLKGVQAYGCDTFTSSSGCTSATVTWFENGNGNNGVDVEFRNKYGWLGSWYYDSGISLYSGYQTHTNIKEEAYKRRVVICGNYYNYDYSFGN